MQWLTIGEGRRLGGRALESSHAVRGSSGEKGTGESLLMDDRVSRLESQSEQLAIRIGALERRLAALEARAPAPVIPIREATADGDGDALARLASLRASDLGAILALVGRTLVVLAGAYLLRALTESGRLTPGPGVLLGLAFALIWIVMAERTGGQGRSLNAAFHGMAFALIAFPILFEAVTRFHFFSTPMAAVGLGSCAAVGLAVASRRQLPGVAWITTLGALITAAALMFVTTELGPFALFLVWLGVATLWLGEWRRWTLLAWPIALGADLSILVLTGRSVTLDVLDTPGMAIAAQALLLLGYLGSVGIRTLVLERDVIPFDVAQSVAAVVVGLGGAAYVTVTGGGRSFLGISMLALAAACYGAAIHFAERHRNFHYYTSMGLLLALMGWALFLPEAALGLVYAALGLSSAWAGRMTQWLTFRAQGALYLVAAAFASGLLAHVSYGLGLPTIPAHAPSGAMLGVLVLSVVAVWGLGGLGQASRASGARVPRLVGLGLVLGGLLGIAAAWLAPAITSGAAPALRGGLVATLRTALLVSVVLALGWTAGTLRFVDGAWLVYPLLLLTGVKFVLEDLRAGEASTLFVGFALYGLALILGPWLCRRRGTASVPPPG